MARLTGGQVTVGQHEQADASFDPVGKITADRINVDIERYLEIGEALLEAEQFLGGVLWVHDKQLSARRCTSNQPREAGTGSARPEVGDPVATEPKVDSLSLARFSSKKIAGP